MKIPLKLKPRVIEVEDAKFHLVPYPFEEVGIGSGESPAVALAFQKRIFLHCVVGWENLTDEDGAPIPCNDETKTHIFNYEHGLRERIQWAINEFLNEKMRLAKNLSESQSGKETPVL